MFVKILDRYAALQNGEFHYYDEEGDFDRGLISRGTVELHGTAHNFDARNSSDASLFEFKLVTSKRTYYFALESESEYYSWRDAFDLATTGREKRGEEPMRVRSKTNV